jgi:hypothetical protein
MPRHRRHEPERPDPTEAIEARLRAEHDLEQRRAEGQRIRALLREWDRIREKNNIRANFEASMRGGRA